MALIAIQLPPGMERNNTPYDTPGRFWDMNQVRWQSSSILPIGGWQRTTGTVLDGAVRKLFVYRDNSNQRNVLVGTDNKIYADQSPYVDITPVGFSPPGSGGVSGGFGTGLFGAGTFGTPRAVSPLFAPYLFYTFANWGEDVILTANRDRKSVV